MRPEAGTAHPPKGGFGDAFALLSGVLASLATAGTIFVAISFMWSATYLAFRGSPDPETVTRCAAWTNVILGSANAIAFVWTLVFVVMVARRSANVVRAVALSSVGGVAVGLVFEMLVHASATATIAALAPSFLAGIFGGILGWNAREGDRFAARIGRALRAAVSREDAGAIFAAASAERYADGRLAAFFRPGWKTIRACMARAIESIDRIERARDVEKRRLAERVHDGLAQELAALVLRLELEASTAAKAARSALRAAQRIMHEPDEDVRGALADLAAGRAELVVSGEERVLAPATRDAVLGIAHEALNNARKHACAKRVLVTLSFADTAVMLDVKDDGKGFDPRRARRGFGLASLHDRADRAGGRVTIESAPGRGTAISAVLP